MAKIVGVKFKNTAKVYYFAPSDGSYEPGSGVVVETARGMEYGTVAFGVKEVPDEEVVQPLKPIVRKATRRDEENVKRNEERTPEAMKIAAEKIARHGLKMKLVGCEFTFDGKKVVFYFTADGRVDFRELVKDLASSFHIRIELRQVGIRDETKLLGGIAPCGRACCCSGCMSDFKKVSIKMAKTQGLSLNPSKISGLCGRLMCCLEYENYYYSDAFKKVPKVGSTVETPDGKGTVVSNNMLTMVVKVKIAGSDGQEVYKDFPLSDVKFRRGNAPEREKEEIPADLKEILD
jgi:PSP1 domain protein